MNGQWSGGVIALAVLVAGTLPLMACGEQPPSLGPTDGFDLPPTDLERVAVGTMAPDFALESYDGRVIRLSDLRGSDVVLVFYRGHW